jgi:Zn-dependent protease with chaperone function
LRNFAVAVALLLSAVSLAAETSNQFDARIEQELRALDPGAVATWRDANAARDANRHAEALELYGGVYSRVPAFVHALRRMAGEQFALGDHALAVKNLRGALAQQRSPENLLSLASFLVQLPNPTTAEREEAMLFAREAVQLAPDDANAYGALAEAAFANQDVDTLRTATRKLEVLAPRELGTYIARYTIARVEGDWTAARAALDGARDAGLSKADYDRMTADLAAATPFWTRWWKPIAISLAAWIVGFGILLLAGVVLSRVAMHAARKVPADLSENATSLGSGVRKMYAAVLVLSSIFYYVSIPIVIALVLGAGGGLIYACFALGRVPVKLVGLIVVVCGVSVWSMLKSLFLRPRDDEPGMRVDLAQQPRLRALLDDVASRIGTRAVDNVYITPGTEVAVMERGKRSAKERCLILGVAALDGLALRPLKAVLGHEYGHFTNRDTAGGVFALAVRNSIRHTAIGIAQGGAATWYNPAWLFVNGFHRVFLRITQGASRLQEVLADRWAVFAYGADAFEAGLRHIVERGVRFGAHIGATLKEVVNQKVALANLYTYVPAAAQQDLSGEIEEALTRKSSPYDSHPTPAERFELVRALPHQGAASGEDDDAPAWSLFNDPAAVQLAMTAQVRENVRANYGVEIIAAPA